MVVVPERHASAGMHNDIIQGIARDAFGQDVSFADSKLTEVDLRSSLRPKRKK